MVVVEVVLLLQVDQVVQEEAVEELVQVQNQVVVELVVKVSQVEVCQLHLVLADQVVDHLKQVFQELLLVLLFLQVLMELVAQEQVMI